MIEMPNMPRSDSERLMRIETMIEQVLVQDKDHETRIRRLERWVWIATGIAAAAGSAVGTYVGQIPTP